MVGGVAAAARRGDDVDTATNLALAQQEKNFGAKLGKVAELSRDLTGRYVYPEAEDEPDTIRQAIGVGALGSAASAAQAYARGRAPGLSPWGAVKAGHASNARNARAIGSWLKPKLAGAASAGSGILNASAELARQAAQRLRR